MISGLTHALSPFALKSFRFQWPADLLTSWAGEMEGIILSWYVIVETGSVLLLTLYGSLQYAGTLLSPLFGVLGDRIGHRNLLCIMRAGYCVFRHDDHDARLHRRRSARAIVIDRRRLHGTGAIFRSRHAQRPGRRLDAAIGAGQRRQRHAHDDG